MNENGLLECPFCGELEVYNYKIHEGSVVWCCECLCRTELCLTMDLAIKKWNTRNGHLYTADDYKQDAEERKHGL